MFDLVMQNQNPQKSQREFDIAIDNIWIKKGQKIGRK